MQAGFHLGRSGPFIDGIKKHQKWSWEGGGGGQTHKDQKAFQG